MKTTFHFLIACLSLLLGSASVSQAANTIDPNATGATDVVQDIFETPVTLTNPLPDPLALGDLILAVGDTGPGELLIDNGSSVTNAIGYIAHLTGSTGLVTVSGNGSLWTNSSSLRVGHESDGTLNVEAGGVVNNGFGYIGIWPGSTGVATVTGSGSQWNNSGPLRVGFEGDGTLNVEAGGVVSGSDGSIGRETGSTGVATVTGSGSQWNNRDSFHIGFEGNGTLNVEAGGVISSRSGVLGFRPGSTGTATVSGSGSQWNNSGDLFVGRNGSGTLNITGGGLMSVRGTLTIDRDTDGNDFINMSTGGMLALFGETNSSLIEFLDLIDGTDAIRYWDDDIADWADIIGASYGDDYTLSYRTAGHLTGYTLLTVGMPADWSIDGFVDGHDFLLWQRDPSAGALSVWEANYGLVISQLAGDFHFDGILDGEDFLLWQRDPSVGSLADWEANYGMGAPLSAISAAVPEPTTAALALAALCLVMSRRRAF